MQNVTLNNGVQMPVLGYGVYQIPDEETEQTVSAAIAAGYRLLDTASSYGNEEAVGQGLRASGVSRRDVFLTTKVWHTNLAPADFRASAEASLQRLGVDDVDLLLVHHPLLLRGVTSVAADRYKGAALTRLIRAEIALLAAHTNADVVESGTSATLASALGLVDITPLAPSSVSSCESRTACS